MGEYKNMYDDFYKKYNLNKIKKFSKNKKTPFLILDIDRVKKNYDRLKKDMDYADIFYAVKANPHDRVLKVLSALGSNFDVASRYELDTLLKLKINPERISFGNTIKKEEDIKYFYKKGVRLFATDSESDLLKNAKGSNVFFRLLVEGEGSDWPLSKKFGAYSDDIVKLAILAKKNGLSPYGISFHVGSQQRDVMQWDQAIAQCKYIFEELEQKGINLMMINLGGGLPSEYVLPTKSLEYYASKIKEFIKNHFGKEVPRIIIEPGRFMVGNSGVLVSEIILINKKSESLKYSWMYIDAGIYQGLDECVGEAIKYPILTDKSSKGERKFVIAGPTCDSHDIVYECEKYSFPSKINEKDKIYFLSAGAYTYQVSSVGFNGFPPLKVYVVSKII